ncbi:MAG: hypothetical protein LBT65_08555 [Synergistaceae bacterium]|jgi:hypothetical protein|nr:hypothetical protein [Synergistaceae bacterium]
MKIIKILLKGLVFAIGVLTAAWIFMPWKQVGEAALLMATRRLAAPASIGCSSVESAPGGFVIHDLDVRGLMSGLINVSCKSLTIAPNPVASLFNMAPTCDVAFTGNALGEILVTPIRKISGITLGDGRFTVSGSAREILLEGVQSNGELAMAGALAITPRATRLIDWADVVMNVKLEAFEKDLPELQAVLGLPLQQEGPGRWVLRRSRPGDAKEGGGQ